MENSRAPKGFRSLEQLTEKKKINEYLKSLRGCGWWCKREQSEGRKVQGEFSPSTAIILLERWHCAFKPLLSPSQTVLLLCSLHSYLRLKMLPLGKSTSGCDEELRIQPQRAAQGAHLFCPRARNAALPNFHWGIIQYSTAQELGWGVKCSLL